MFLQQQGTDEESLKRKYLDWHPQDDCDPSMEVAEIISTTPNILAKMMKTKNSAVEANDGIAGQSPPR